jgi:16S rRNA (cytosine1402-N4)-methyltransferase
LIDLGISSPQVDEAERGFSFRLDSYLDMRMDQTKGITAADIVNTYAEQDLIHALKIYGEEKFARKIVRAIVTHREEKGPIKMTLELADLIKNAVPKRDIKKNPATKTFQALRILVNKELEELQGVLPKVFSYLKPKARLVVISFHSLEDRIVKNYTKSLLKTDFIPKNIPIKASEIKAAPFKVVQKMITPSLKEIEKNPRSRSAKLRVVEKVVDEE